MRGVDARRSWLQYESIFIEIALLDFIRIVPGKKPSVLAFSLEFADLFS